MEFEDLKAQWRDYHQRLDRSLSVSRRLFKEVRMSQLKAKLRRLLALRVAETLCFLIITIALGAFIGTHLSPSAPTVSASILMVFAIIGLSGSIGQIALLGSFDYVDSVTSLQRQLARIQTHAIGILRLLLLSVPFYLSYVFLGFKAFFNIDLYLMAHRPWLILNLVLSVGLIVPVFWLYRELSFKATSHSWVRRLIKDSGGKSVAAAAELLEEIEMFEQET